MAVWTVMLRAFHPEPASPTRSGWPGTAPRIFSRALPTTDHRPSATPSAAPVGSLVGAPLRSRLAPSHRGSPPPCILILDLGLIWTVFRFRAVRRKRLYARRDRPCAEGARSSRCYFWQHAHFDASFAMLGPILIKIKKLIKILRLQVRVPGREAEGTATSTSFWGTFLTHFPAPTPPHARRVMCSA